jgi:hypothetical protein
MVVRVLHLFEDNAFLHLANILLLDYSHQIFESVVNSIRVELVTFSHALTQEVVTVLFR